MKSSEGSPAFSDSMSPRSPLDLNGLLLVQARSPASESGSARSDVQAPMLVNTKRTTTGGSGTGESTFGLTDHEMHLHGASEESPKFVEGSTGCISTDEPDLFAPGRMVVGWTSDDIAQQKLRPKYAPDGSTVTSAGDSDEFVLGLKSASLEDEDQVIADAEEENLLETAKGGPLAEGEASEKATLAEAHWTTAKLRKAFQRGRNSFTTVDGVSVPVKEVAAKSSPKKIRLGRRNSGRDLSKSGRTLSGRRSFSGRLDADGATSEPGRRRIERGVSGRFSAAKLLQLVKSKDTHQA